MRRFELILSCDVCNGEVPGQETPAQAATICFGLNGMEYETELCAWHRQALDELAGTIASHGRPAHGRAKPTYRNTDHRRRTADIRQWAILNGLEISNHGRIPHKIEAAFRESAS